MLCPGSLDDFFWEIWDSIVPKSSSGSQNLKKVFWLGTIKNFCTSRNQIAIYKPLEKYDSLCSLGKRVQNWFCVACFDFFTISMQMSGSLTKCRIQDTLGDSAWHYLLDHIEVIIGEGIQNCNSYYQHYPDLFKKACRCYRLQACNPFYLLVPPSNNFHCNDFHFESLGVVAVQDQCDSIV